MAVDKELKRLETRHPRWEKLNSQWEEINDILYDEVRLNKQKYIQKGQAEVPEDYDLRLSMSRFKGEVASSLQKVVGAVFTTKPSRPKELTNRWGQLISDADGSNTSLDQFMEDTLFNALGFGFHAILIDKYNPGDSEESTSKGFESVAVGTNDTKSRLYLVPYFAYQVVDWSMDRHGEFHWVRLYEENVRVHVDPNSEPEAVDIYREYDRTSWRVYHVKHEKSANNRSVKKCAELKGEGKHNLGIVPICIVGTHGRRMCYESAIRYIYHYDIEIFQNSADLKWDTWLHAHPTLIDYTVDEKKSRFAVGPNAREKKMAQHGERAEYLEYPAGATDQLRSNIKSGIDGIRRLSGMDPLGASDEPGALGASGKAREVAFSVGEARFLRRYASALSNCESRIFEVSERWEAPTKNDVPPSERLNEYVTTYPSNFTIQAAEAIVDLWLTTRTEINSEDFDREMQRRIASQLLGDIGSEKLDAILKQIEENPLIKATQASNIEEDDVETEEAIGELERLSKGDIDT